MKLVGYSDQVSVEAGGTVRIMVSSDAPETDISFGRMLGDLAGTAPAIDPVPSAAAGRYATRRQPLRSGSYVVGRERPVVLGAAGAVTVCLWAWPTRLAAGEQTLISSCTADGRGWTLDVTGAGRVRFSFGDARQHALVTDKALRERVWYFIGASLDARTGRVDLLVDPQIDRAAPSRSEIVERTTASAGTALRGSLAHDAPLLIAASWLHDDGTRVVGRTFNGKLAAPRLLGRSLGAEELAAERDRVDLTGYGDQALAAWDLARDLGARRVVDVSGNERHGEAVQMPARGVTGPRWTGDASCFREAPAQYDAIHFHDDDLDDAGWEPTVTWDVPADSVSGLYAVCLDDGAGGRDHVPIVVRPRRGAATARILLVLPHFSYLAYANAHYSGDDAAMAPPDRYIHDHGLNSTYDTHADGSGVIYASWRRPLVSLRAGYEIHGRVPHGLSADLHLVAWLRRGGHGVDMITDADLHRDGTDALASYDVVLSGTHAEYWSGPMLDALSGYLDAGGRYMYLSGNGLYWVTGLEPERGHTIEIRRCGASTARWHAEPGEGRLSTTGEPGGLWRWRGRAPQRYVGVGFSAAPTGKGAVGAPYAREAGSHDPRVAFVFEGIGADDAIGDFPNRVFEHGAAGVELDRLDHALGTPAHALRLASATGFAGDTWAAAVEETRQPDVRADLVFFETPGGGAVFSTGSISWCGALSHNAYENNVARITDNVLRRFLSPEPFELPTLG